MLFARVGSRLSSSVTQLGLVIAGTFLGNCEEERVTNNYAATTSSYWMRVLNEGDRFVNATYKPNLLPNTDTDAQSEVIFYPNTSLEFIRFWSSCYPQSPIFST
jgi:hypothetical protein